MWDMQDPILTAQEMAARLRLSTPVRFRQLSEGAQLPKFGTKDSACFDIHACLLPGTTVRMYSSKNVMVERELVGDSVVLSPMERILIPTGWAVECPDQYSLRIFSRSGLTLKQGLIVVNGVGMVDADYRHEVFVLMSNVSGCASPITHGDRVAQGEFVKQQHQFTMVLVESTDEEWFTTTRTGGFGSTGV